MGAISVGGRVSPGSLLFSLEASTWTLWPSRVSPKNATKRAYKAVGKLFEGVVILAPKSKPTHFTSKQIRSTIHEVLKRTGKDDLGEADPERG
jgi:hypothetical protein